MLNVTLRNQITFPEFRLLYDSRMRLSNYTVKQELRNYIKSIRGKYNNAEIVDALTAKLEKLGNKGGWYKVKVKELERLVYDINKTVPNSGQGEWRSIEFELLFKGENSRDEFVAAVRAKGYSKAVTIKEDHSIKPDDGDGSANPQEVVLMYKTGNEQIVRDVCAMLKGRAYINNSCGTHVHFDMRHVGPNEVKQYGQRVARAVPALKTILPKPRRNNKFCVSNINNMESRGDPHERYSFVNLQSYPKYKTLEIRGHSATLKADKILTWIKICEKIMNTRVRSKTEEITSPAELIKLFKFDDETIKYIKDRYTKFNNGQVLEVMDEAATIPPAPPGL